MTHVSMTRAGAVAGTGVDAPVAAHFGDPLREQRTLLTSGGVVDRTHRGVVTVTGPDRLTWLHSLTSQHLERLSARESTEALILSPHGHVEHHLVLTDDGSTTWIDVEPGTAEALVAYLDSMRFMLRVEVTDRSATYGVLTAVGAGDLEVPGAPVVRRMVWGTDVVVAVDDAAVAVDAIGLPLAGHGAFEALRVAASRPRLGFDTDHRTIPHEVGWIGAAVHLDKGCYRGQETVARVHNLGKPPRRLVRLLLDGSRDELPAPRTAVSTMEGREVGFLGTAVQHAELGPVALALVKRSVADGETLVVDGMNASVDPDGSLAVAEPAVGRIALG